MPDFAGETVLDFPIPCRAGWVLPPAAQFLAARLGAMPLRRLLPLEPSPTPALAMSDRCERHSRSCLVVSMTRKCTRCAHVSAIEPVKNVKRIFKL